MTGQPKRVPCPIAFYTIPTVTEDVARSMVHAVGHHNMVRRAAAGAAVGNWDVFVGLIETLYERPELALGVARACIADLVECALVAAKGEGERAAEYFETLLEAQLEKDDPPGGMV